MSKFTLLFRSSGAVLLLVVLLLLSGQVPGTAQDITDEPGDEVVVTDVTPTEAPTETEATPSEAPTELPTEAPTTEPPPAETATTEAPPAETPVATAEITDVATAIPTADATSTVEVTAAPTEPPLPTETATTPTVEPPTPTPTATYEAPSVPEPALALLYNETFERDDLSAWRVGEGWALAIDDTSRAFETVITAAFQYAPATPANVAVEARFSTNTGTAALLVRQSSDGAYSAALSPDGRLELARSGETMRAVTLAPSSGGWRTLRLSAMDNALRVAVDGVEVIALVDPVPLPAGTVTIAAVLPTEGGRVLVDDINLWQPNSEVTPTPPTAEATMPVEPTAEITATADVTATAEATPEVTRIVVVPTQVTDLGGTGTLPTAPVLWQLPNNAYSRTTTPTLTWRADPNAAAYQVVIARDATFRTPVALPGQGVVTTASYTTPTLGQGVFYWKVRARNSEMQFGPYSTTRAFTVDSIAPAQAPTLLSPANGSQTTNQRPTLSWQGVQGASRYRVYLYPSTGNAFVAGIVTTTSFQPAGALLYRTYRWQVEALDAAGNVSPMSLNRTLVINSADSAAPIPNRFTTATVPLSWTPISWALAYQVQVDDNSDFSSPVFNQANVPANQFTVTTTALNEGTYFWRVRAQRTSTTWGGWSAVGRFTVETSTP